MNNLGILALCPWLSPKDVKESRDFVPVIDKEQKDLDAAYFKSLEAETDTCFPNPFDAKTLLVNPGCAASTLLTYFTQ